MSDEQICHVCNQPVLDGQGRYTAGEDKGLFCHWECRDQYGFRESMAELDSELKAMETINPMKSVNGVARAAGGYQTHMVDRGTALCGHTPKNRGTMNRARWYKAGGEVTCRRCREKITRSATAATDSKERT